MRDERLAARTDASLQNGEDQPSLVEAIERVAQAGIEVLDKRFDLIQLEVRSAISRSVGGGAFLLVALVVAIVGWVALMIAGQIVLRPSLGDAGALAAIAGVNFVLGAILASLGLKSLSKGT